MAAAVETMAFVGEVPWHKLGVQVDEDIDLDEFRRSAGLDWEVQKSPVQFAGLCLPGANSGLHGFKDKFVLNRTTDNRPYAIVTSRYKPVQPKEVFEFFRDLLSQQDMKMHTAGSLMDGGRIWALAKTGDSAFIRGMDKVDSYLLLSTSYDLTLSTVAQFTSVRVVCNNTLQQAVAGASAGRVSLTHCQDFNSDGIKSELGIGREQWAAFVHTLDVLGKIKLDGIKAREVMNTVFALPEDIAIPDPNRLHANNVVDLFTFESYRGADLAGKTAWGLLNATTEYIDHHKRARSQDNRLASAWFGPGAALKNECVNELMKLAA